MATSFPPDGTIRSNESDSELEIHLNWDGTPNGGFRSFGVLCRWDRETRRLKTERVPPIGAMYSGVESGVGGDDFPFVSVSSGGGVGLCSAPCLRR